MEVHRDTDYGIADMPVCKTTDERTWVFISTDPNQKFAQDYY
jgi:hypothetical protein